jgi:outer membrane lipopolysaccharide assembly protein LptE/RlpB
MRYSVNTLLIILFTLILTACSQQPSEEASMSKENLIDAVEANAEIAPAKAMEEMKLEVEETADEITEEIPLVAPDQTSASE